MPLYEYRCTQCGYRFEKIQSFSAEPETVCAKCGGVLERPLTAPALQFKGAGWYVNDYAPKGGGSSSAEKPAEGAGKPAESTAKPAASESKPASEASTPASSPAPSSPSASSSSTTS